MDHLTLLGLWHARVPLLAWTLVGALSAGFFTVTNKPSHEVAARLLVEQGPAPLDERKPNLDRNFMPTQAEIASSPTVVGTAAARVWESDAAKGVEPLSLVQVLGALSVDPLIGSNVLSVRFVHSNRDVAKKMVEEIIVEYREFLLTNERDRNEDSLVALASHQKQLTDREQELLDHQANLRSQISMIGVGRDGHDVQRDLLADLSQQVSLANSRRLLLMEQLKTLRDAGMDEYSVSLNTGELPTLSDAKANIAMEVLHHAVADGWSGIEDPAPIQVALLEARLAYSDLENKLGPKHSELISATSRVEALERRVATLAREVPSMVNRELIRATSVEQQLTSLYQTEIDRVKSQDGVRIREQRILEDLAEVRREKTQIASQIVQRRLVSDAESGRAMTVLVRTLEAPSYTSTPLFAQPKVVVALGIGFGLLGGLLTLTLRPITAGHDRRDSASVASSPHLVESHSDAENAAHDAAAASAEDSSFNKTSSSSINGRVRRPHAK